MEFYNLTPKSRQNFINAEKMICEEHKLIIRNMFVQELRSFSKSDYKKLLNAQFKQQAPTSVVMTLTQHARL